jgi:hypothetical protein
MGRQLSVRGEVIHASLRESNLFHSHFNSSSSGQNTSSPASNCPLFL